MEDVMRKRTVAVAFALVSSVLVLTGCGESPTGPDRISVDPPPPPPLPPPPPPPPPPVNLASGDWTITYVTPLAGSQTFCSFFFGARTLNFSQVTGTGNLQGTTTTGYFLGNLSIPTQVATSGSVDAEGNVQLTVTVTPQASRPAGCAAGSYFGPVTISIRNLLAAPGPPDVRQRINGGVYTITAQGNTVTGSVASLAHR
jgi:hypothetical protein